MVWNRSCLGGVERGGGGGGDATSDRCGDDQPALRAATRELMRLWRSVFDMRERERGEGGGGGVEATGEWRSALVGVVTGSVSPSSSFEVVGVRLTRATPRRGHQRPACVPDVQSAPGWWCGRSLSLGARH